MRRTPRGLLWEALRTGRSVSDVEDPRTFGNKTAYLTMLRRVAAQNLSLSAQVPSFWGLSHNAVWSHLQKHGGPVLAAALRAGDLALRKDSGTLSSATQQRLSELQECVFTTLKNHPVPLPEAQIRAMERFPLMVRSTGREDSDKVTNAGGNESVANVPPGDTAARDEAVARVVASYFSPRSLLQRLVSDDDVLATPFVPVLFQHMVAAAPGAAPLVAGVLFTREPEGPTPGVSQIEASYGHGEGVVQSSVEVDTYFVTAGRETAVIRRKPERLEPNPDGVGLRRVANDTQLRMERSLPATVVARLHAYGRAVALECGGPMDIEFAYDPSTDIIHPLQARPLILPARDQPSHLDSAAIRTLPQLQGDVICAAGGSVRRVNAASIITAPTLVQALHTFLHHPRRNQFTAVLVEQMAAPMSHEAITFRASHMAVLCVPDVLQAHEFVKNHSPLLLDSGRGVLVAAETLLSNGAPRAQVIRPGWSKHPLPAHCSVLPEADLSREETGRVAAFLRQPVPAGVAPKARFAELLAQCTDGSALDCAAMMGVILRQAATWTRWLQRDPALAPRAALVLQAVARACCRVYAADDTIHRIFELNWLQALLVQQSHAVQGDSLVSLLAERARRAEDRSQGLADDAWLVAFNRISAFALRPAVADQWRAFFNAVRQDPQANAGLAALLMHLQSLQVLPLWLNAVFPSLYSASGGDALACVRAVARDVLEGANRDAIEWSKKARVQTAAWQQKSDGWGAPRNFDALWSDFEPSFTETFAEAMAHLAQTNTLGKIAVLEWVRETVETYDHLIKRLTGSTDYDNDGLKVARFATMLQPFVGMLEQFQPHVPSLQNEPAVSLAEALASRTEALRGSRELQPGPQFIAATAQIGGVSSLQGAQPQTLEDIFTLTHQNMLSLFGAAHAELAVRQESLPQALRDLADPLLQVSTALDGGFRCAPRLVSINYAFPRVTLNINAPLRVHGIGMQITWDQTQRHVARFEVRMVGDAEGNRGERMKLAAALFGAGIGVPFAPGGAPRSDNQARSLQWTWNVPTDGPVAKKFAELWPRCLVDVSATTFERESFAALLQRIGDYVSLPGMLNKRNAKFFADYPWYNHELLQLSGGKWQPYTAELLTAMFRRPIGADQVALDIRREMGSDELPERAHNHARKWLVRRFSDAKLMSRLETLVEPEQFDALNEAVKQCFPDDERLHRKVDDYL